MHSLAGTNWPTMRVTIYLTDAQAEQLENLARLEHRTVRQQATVLVLKALGPAVCSAPPEPQSESVAA
jgi:hypothetical protein